MPYQRPSRAQVLAAAREGIVLALACLASYWLATTLLSRASALPHDDDLLGGMWAVIATVFVLRDSYQQSIKAALTRMTATAVSFVVCLLYLAFLPFHVWALGLLAGASAAALIVAGRPGDAATAAITTTVIMVVAAISPQHAWEQPVLRLADTVIGIAVGVAVAWIDLRVIPRDRPGRGAPRILPPRPR